MRGVGYRKRCRRSCAAGFPSASVKLPAEPTASPAAGPRPRRRWMPLTNSRSPAPCATAQQALRQAAPDPSACTDTDSGPRVVSPPTSAIVVPAAQAPAVPCDSAPRNSSSMLRQVSDSRIPGGVCAHRREVAEIHGQRAMADGAARGLPTGKCTTFDERIERRHQLHSGRHCEHRGVIADAE